MRIFIMAVAILAMAGQLTGGGAQAQTAAGGKMPAAFVFCYQGHVADSRIVVVDKARQRLVVLRYIGKLVADYEYPCATGENPGNKQKAGDERTPEGVYFITKRYKDNKITIFGNRALHLNYPNAYDRLDGRQGNGIFIHGTNKTLRPRSSNGCITLRNEDLTVVASLVKDQQTPILVMDRFEIGDLAQQTKACNFLQNLKISLLSNGKPTLPDGLALRDLPKRETTLRALERAFPGATAGFDNQVRVKTLGLALFGVGERWVINADQIARHGKGPSLNLTRRFYLDHGAGKGSRLVHGAWIVQDATSAGWLVRRVKRAKPAVVVATARPAAQPAIAPAPKPFVKIQKETINAEAQIKKMLARWLSDWQRKHLRRYLNHYAHDFKADGQNKKAWAKSKAKLNRVYKRITVQVKNLKITSDGSRAKVSFLQLYRSDWHKDVGIKNLDLVYRKGRWKILSETWEPVKDAGAKGNRG